MASPQQQTPTLLNVTLDDFDPPLVYADQSQWATPDPSAEPARFNQTTADGEFWQGTTHSTTVDGAQVAFNFSGASLQIYGSSTVPPFIDLTSSQTSVSPSYDATNPLPAGLLFAASALDPADEVLVSLTNAPGGNLTLDRVVYAAPVGDEGATLTRTFLDETSPEITYSGAWESNANDLFWGGSTTYTSEQGAAFEFAFEGSAVWIYGDQVNDHGPFSLALNGSTLDYTLSGASGCGGVVGKNCEKLGTLAWVRAGLPAGTHTVRVENRGSGGQAFFDLDYITYVTPSVAYSPSSSNTSSPDAASSLAGVSSTAALSPSASASASPAGGTSAALARAPGPGAGATSAAAAAGAVVLCAASWAGWV